jgi:predicted RNase H-like HicB family nuclease
MKEITFLVEPCEETGMLVASWDDPGGQGGIVTQGRDLHDLEEMVRDAVHCHFEGAEVPEKIRLHP